MAHPHLIKEIALQAGASAATVDRALNERESESDTFSELERWIAEHLKSNLRVNALTQRVHMNPRNFARIYAEKRGRTPAKAVEAIRVDAAPHPLEETDDRIESIAEDCGFNNEEQMRCAFVRILKIPPRASKAVPFERDA